jgi:hypothetical protein
MARSSPLLSKTRIKQGKQCLKSVYLQVYRPELAKTKGFTEFPSKQPI